MPAKFVKVTTGPLGDFDGFDQKVGYQMVPVGQDRTMSVVSDAEPCIITVDPINVARMHNFHFDRGVPDTPGDFSVILTANNRVTFDIWGQAKGNTNVKLSTQN